MASGGSLLVSFLKQEKPSYQLAGLLGPPCVSPMACGRCIILRLLIRKDAQRHPFLVMGKIRRETAQADVAVGLCNLSLPMMRLC